jgi:hypothetical protein
MVKSTTGHKPPTKSTKTSTNYESPTVSDDEDHPSLDDLPKTIKLANAYAEYLDPLNTKSVRLLAKEYGCGRTALQDRVNGKSVSWEEKCADQQRLTVLEELALVEWCHQLEAWGFPPKVESLRRMAIDMLLDKEDLEELGINWQERWLDRHPDLKSKFIPPLDKERAMAHSVGVFERYFALFWAIIEEYDLYPEDIHNMDEKGFMQGVIAKERVIVSRDQHFKGKSFITQDGSREWTTIIDCVSMDGRKTSPWVIFKGIVCKKAWMTRILEYNPLSHITMSHNGWTDNAIGLEWFIKVFIPETKPSIEGRWRLMLFDGHSSHITSEVIRTCVANKIILLCLPPHSTHLLQPLDIGLFGPLAAFYKCIIRTKTKFGYTFSVDKLVFLEAYLEARDKAFSLKNIESAWRKAGLQPFDPRLVIDALPVVQIEPSSSSRPITPLESTSSSPPILQGALKTPAHVNDIQRILQLQRDGQIDNPQAYLTKVCKAAEKAIAERLILGNHNTDMLEALARKKERLNRDGQKIAKEDARVYDARSLEERELWSNEKKEELLIIQFMKWGPLIFDFKPKKARKVKDPRASPIKSPIKRPRTKKLEIALDPFTLEPLVALTFENLFLLPEEDRVIPSEPLKLVDPLKQPKLPKAKKPPVQIPVSMVVILKYDKEGDIALRIREIGEIRSSRGRTIRLTNKGLAIRKKNK